MTDRVEIQVRHFCTHPEAKAGEGCPKGWTCNEIMDTETGEDPQSCYYLEVEVAKETGK